jgi:PHD/YefM family antitoxin component YafN of YafNO toxin-antitoxin module
MIPKHAALIPLADLELDAASVVARVRASEGPAVIMEGQRATAVLLSIEVYEQGEAERAILNRLARGEQEIAGGQGHDLEEVLAAADSLLSPRRP